MNMRWKDIPKAQSQAAPPVPVGDSIDVLDKGFVRLDAVSADDLSVVNAARVSFGKRHETMEDGDDKLIQFLMREKHGTPFEHNFFRFHVKAPIFVVREWFRHRIGWSYNEYSGRYAEIETEGYIPAPAQIRTQVGKPGAYTFHPLPAAQYPIDGMQSAYAHSFFAYKTLIKQGVAKEVARMVLPVGTYTEFYATTNARALLNFISLRADEHAQWEIQQYAQALASHLQQHMPITWEAYETNNRVAP